MRRPGKISPTKAARLLGVHVNTVYTWCRRAVNGRPSRLRNVEQNAVTGYFYVDLDEVKAMKGEGDPNPS